jgi:hypothetical protein
VAITCWEDKKAAENQGMSSSFCKVEDIFHDMGTTANIWRGVVGEGWGRALPF